MNVWKKNGWVWFVYPKGARFGCYDASTWGLCLSTLTTRGRVIKQPPQRTLWRRCFHYFKDLNYYFDCFIATRVLLFVLFVWNHSLLWFWYKKRILAFWKTIDWLLVFALLDRICFFFFQGNTGFMCVRRAFFVTFEWLNIGSQKLHYSIMTIKAVDLKLHMIHVKVHHSNASFSMSLKWLDWVTKLPFLIPPEYIYIITAQISFNVSH